MANKNRAVPEAPNYSIRAFDGLDVCLQRIIPGHRG